MLPYFVSAFARQATGFVRFLGNTSLHLYNPSIPWCFSDIPSRPSTHGGQADRPERD